MEIIYGLVMPFEDESHSFVHGFECGIIWHRMDINDKFEKHLCHTQNIRQIKKCV